MNDKIVITGLGVVSALGIGKKALLAGLQQGLSGIKELTHYNTDELFTCGGEVQEIADELIPCDRASYMLDLALQEALAERGLLETAGELRIGAVVGSAQGGLRTGERIQQLFTEGSQIPPELWGQYPVHRLQNQIAGRIPLSGPEVALSNACVSSTMALGIAMDALRDGLADVMIVAGVDTMTRFVSAGFQSLKAVTGNLNRPFDQQRDGIIPGEGAGVLILEREATGKSGTNIYGELVGFGSAADAVHMTAPDKNGSGAALSIKMALAEAGLQPGEIDFIIPHGTGTLYNDAMEYAALAQVFGDAVGDIPVCSIKPTLGHTMGAAGVMSAITALLALKHSFLPANLNYETPDELLPLNVVTVPRADRVSRHILIMTSAFGGSNAVAVFSNPDQSVGSKEGVL